MLGRGHGNAQRGGGFLEIQTHEVTQLHQFRLARINGRKFFQGVIYGEQLVIIRDGRRNFESIQVNDLNARAAFCRHSSPGVFNQDATHRLGRRPEEMSTILKGRCITAAQPHPSFVDKGGWLERMPSGFVCHLLRSQTAEFFVNDREQFGVGFWIALFHPFQNMRELAQAFRIGKRRLVTTLNALNFKQRCRVACFNGLNSAMKRWFAPKPKITCNARIGPKEQKEFCALDDATKEMLKMAMTELNFSARAYDRIVKVARTIADLAGAENISSEHISEAIQYRSLDRQLWT